MKTSLPLRAFLGMLLIVVVLLACFAIYTRWSIRSQQREIEANLELIKTAIDAYHDRESIRHDGSGDGEKGADADAVAQ